MARYRVQALAVVLSFSLVARADAASLPEFTGAVNKIIAAVVEKNATRRGLSMAGTVGEATLSALGARAAVHAGTYAAAAATAASAPVWLSVAAFVGSAALAAGIAYGVYKILWKGESIAGWSLQKPGVVGDPVPAASYVLNEDQGYGLATGNVMGNTVWGSPGTTFDNNGIPNRSAEKYAIRPVYNMGYRWSGLIGSHTNPEPSILPLHWASYVQKEGGTVLDKGCVKSGEMNYTCSITYRWPWSGSDAVQSVEVPVIQNPYYSQAGETSSGSVAELVAQIPESEMTKPADPALVAAVANGLWQEAAAQEGYKGVPYSASDPITLVDAQAVQAERPTEWPTNADLVSPVTTSAGAAVQIGAASTPTTGTENPPVAGMTNVNVVNTPTVRLADAVEVNWGTAPTVHEPTISGTPTAQQILSPVLTLMPGLKTLVIPKPAMVCPTAGFTVFDHAFVVDSHCEVVEAARPTLFSVMAFVWVALGAMIVLRA